MDQKLYIKHKKLSFPNNSFDTRDENDSSTGMTMHHRRRSSRMAKKISKMKDFSESRNMNSKYLKTHREPEKGNC